MIRFDTGNLQTAFINRNGTETAFGYGADGRLLTLTLPRGTVGASSS